MKPKRIKTKYHALSCRIPVDLFRRLNAYRLREKQTWPDFLAMLLHIFEGGIPLEDRVKK